MVRIHPPQPKIKMNSKNNLVIFSGNSNPNLAKKIVKKLNKPLGKATVGRFSDQEMNIKIEENVRGKDVFIVQSTCFPANDNLMELIIMIDALRRHLVFYQEWFQNPELLWIFTVFYDLTLAIILFYYSFSEARKKGTLINIGE